MELGRPGVQRRTAAMNRVVAAIAVISVVLGHVDAHAQEVRSLTVQFADLDLNTSEGAQKLVERLREAAVRLCTARGAGATLREKQRYAACIELAVSNASARVTRPVLTE